MDFLPSPSGQCCCGLADLFRSCAAICFSPPTEDSEAPGPSSGTSTAQVESAEGEAPAEVPSSPLDDCCFSLTDLLPSWLCPSSLYGAQDSSLAQSRDEAAPATSCLSSLFAASSPSSSCKFSGETADLWQWIAEPCSDNNLDAATSLNPGLWPLEAEFATLSPGTSQLAESPSSPQSLGLDRSAISPCTSEATSSPADEECSGPSSLQAQSSVAIAPAEQPAADLKTTRQSGLWQWATDSWEALKTNNEPPAPAADDYPIPAFWPLDAELATLGPDTLLENDAVMEEQQEDSSVAIVIRTATCEALALCGQEEPAISGTPLDAVSDFRPCIEVYYLQSQSTPETAAAESEHGTASQNKLTTCWTLVHILMAREGTFIHSTQVTDVSSEVVLQTPPSAVKTEEASRLVTETHSVQSGLCKWVSQTVTETSSTVITTFEDGHLVIDSTVNNSKTTVESRCVGQTVFRTSQQSQSVKVVRTDETILGCAINTTQTDTLTAVAEVWDEFCKHVHTAQAQTVTVVISVPSEMGAQVFSDQGSTFTETRDIFPAPRTDVSQPSATFSASRPALPWKYRSQLSHQ